MRARRFLPLRKLLFLATVLIVIASIGIAFGVGAVLTRSAVENANLDGLARQAQLIKNQQEAGLCAFCRLKDVRAFLAEQHELIRVVDLDRNTPYLTDSQRLELASKPLVTGTVGVEGKRYLVAAGTIKGGRRPGLGFVLLRPSSLKTAGWGPYLRALLIAGAIGAGLAALGSLIIARWISRPVR
ncbi:MAG TPA: hypothetical protein VE995_04165, partial [Gaiellaceae bacterium]|nr:hypothetical protein [Gaiellaceae bacterium]